MNWKEVEIKVRVFQNEITRVAMNNIYSEEVIKAQKRLINSEEGKT